MLFTRNMPALTCALVATALACKPTTPGGAVTSALAVPTAAGQPTPATVAAAGPASAPTPAAAPASATATAAPSAQPTELAQPPFPMPAWYAPLFVKGNQWTYAFNYKYTNPGDADNTGSRVATCRIVLVTVQNARAVAKRVCVGMGSTGGFATDSFAADRNGLWEAESPYEGYPAKALRILANPVTTSSNVFKRDDSGTVTIQVKWQNAPVLGKAAQRVAEYTCDLPDGGGSTTKQQYAEGIGIVGQSYDGGDDAWRTTSATLVTFTAAHVKPAGGQPELAELADRAKAAGLRCVPDVAELLVAAQPGAPPPTTIGGFAAIPSDVHPGTVNLRGKLGTSCTFTVESRPSGVLRIGTFWTGKPSDLLKLAGVIGPPAENLALARGSAVWTWRLAEGLLAVYVPNVAKPDYEWWLYDTAAWTEAERAIWRAYASNDAGVELAASKDPAVITEAIGHFREATQTLPSYGRAWLRLCKLAQRIGKPTKDYAEALAACGKAGQSAFPDVRKEASALVKAMAK